MSAATARRGSLPDVGRAVAAALVATVLLLAVPAAPAYAQPFEEIGLIEGTIDGEPRTWYALSYRDDEGTVDGTAHYQIWFERMFDLEIQAHPEPRFAVEGTLSVRGSSWDGVPSDCPCVLNDPEVSYWSGSSMFDDVYMIDHDAPDVDVTLDLFEPVGDDAYRAEGSFRAVLFRYAGFLDEADLDDSLTVEGTFTIERVLLLDLDLE